MVAAEVEKELRKVTKPIKVAVMGCIVNGPGEAADADVALVAGRDVGFIYVKGERVCRVKPDERVRTVMA